MPSPVLGLSLLLAWMPAAAAGDPPAPAAVEWNARNAEHLLNRAGFGARPAEIEAAVAMGQAAFVDQLLAGAAAGADPDYEPFAAERFEPPERGERDAMSESERREARNELRRQDRRQLTQFAGWWAGRMLDGRHPLRERMTLFWHGYFTSSARDVRSSAAMIGQNELFRTRGLGRFGDLLRAIVHDPAMLEYLDNNQNRKGNPNENFAREVMELFTLGEGHYTEQDIKEAARALTGWTTRRGEAQFVKGRHDAGPKTILGVTADFDPDSFVTLLLAQPACPKWVAQKLLVDFEGCEPSDARLSDYAEFLRGSDYDVGAFLKRLFLDPEFYSDAVVGTRIAGPIDYLVGSARRLAVDPPPVLIWLAAGQLGQRLLEPPSVKGWDGGQAWITTSTLMQRGNLAGMLLGVVSLEDVLRPESLDEVDGSGETRDSGMDGAMGDDTMGEDTMGEGAMSDGPGDDVDGQMGGTSGGEASKERPVKNGARRKPATPGMKGELGEMNRLLADGYAPAINLTVRLTRAGAVRDADVVDRLADELLAVPLTPESRADLIAFLSAERAGLGLDEGRLGDAGHAGEMLLRRLAHLILSLPEAQLS